MSSLRFQLIQAVHDAVASVFPNVAAPHSSVERPRDSSHGDFASNVALLLAKQLRQPPMQVAEQLRAHVQSHPVLERVDVAAPGFLNFFVRGEQLNTVVSDVLQQRDRFGSSRVGSGKRVVVDYSGVNIAKPMHVGHLRSTIIGQALYNIYKFLGWETVGDNHLGDWGTQFGKLLVMYKREYGDAVQPITLEDLTRLYVGFGAAAEKDAALEDAARAETKKLQEGDMVNRKLWQHFTSVSLQDFQKVYDLLHIKFDYSYGESFYQDLFAEVIQLCQTKNIARESEARPPSLHSSVSGRGALIVEFAEDRHLPPFMLRKADGAALYGTSDLATLLFRQRTWQPDLILYVVANEQALHFAQLFAVSDLLGWFPVGTLAHVKFGMVLGSDGKKFSTRRGGVVGLASVLEEAVARAKAAVDAKNSTLPEAERQQIAQTIGVAAVMYNDLSQNRVNDIRFDWDAMLSLQGNSAPYLLYTYARLRSVLRKAGKVPSTAALADAEERQLARHLLHFPDIVLTAAETNCPNLIATYCFELAEAANGFYERVPILQAAPDRQASRLALVDAVAQVLKNGLALLHIPVLERM